MHDIHRARLADRGCGCSPHGRWLSGLPGSWPESLETVYGIRAFAGSDRQAPMIVPMERMPVRETE